MTYLLDNLRSFIKMLILTLILGYVSAFLGVIYVSNDLTKATIVGLFFSLIVLHIIFIIFVKSLLKSISNPLFIYISFYSIYFITGLLPISTYRGYINISFWVLNVIYGLVSFIIGCLVANKLYKSDKIVQSEMEIIRKPNKIILILIFIWSLISAFIIVTKYGLVFSNPELRFDISPWLQYGVESSIPAIILYGCFYTFNKSSKIIYYFPPIIVFILLLSLGYRNQPMLLCLSFAFIYLIKNKIKLNIKKVFIISVIGVFIIMLFSYMYLIRIDNSNRLLNWDKTVSTFSIKYPKLLIPIIPLHMNSREGLGVAELAIERRNIINNFVNVNEFFFNDLTTLLPGKQVTAGQILGIIVNNDSTASLTPTLLGGLYISFGKLGIVVFYFCVGVLLTFLWNLYKKKHSPYILTILITFLVYLIEATNRGLFKPMYIFSFVIIAIIYVFSVKDRGHNI